MRVRRRERKSERGGEGFLRQHTERNSALRE